MSMDNDFLNAFAVSLVIIWFSLSMILTAAEWRILNKAGEKGWKVLIPFYNVYITHRIIGMSHIWFIVDMLLWALEIAAVFLGELVWFDMMLGIITLFFTFISEIVHINKLCNVFGKGEGFKLGTFFFPYIFIPIIAFGSCRYAPPGTEHPDRPYVNSTAAEVRKLENNLMTLGGGIVAVSVWSLLKVFSAAVLEDTISSSMSDFELRVAYMIFGLVTVACFLLCCFVGLSARSEARGKKRHYLVLAAVLILFNSLFVLFEILYFCYDSFTLSSAVSILFDFTVFIFLIDLMSSSIKLRRIRKYKDHCTGKGDSHEF